MCRDTYTRGPLWTAEDRGADNEGRIDGPRVDRLIFRRPGRPTVHRPTNDSRPTDASVIVGRSVTGGQGRGNVNSTPRLTHQWGRLSVTRRRGCRDVTLTTLSNHQGGVLGKSPWQKWGIWLTSDMISPLMAHFVSSKSPNFTKYRQR